MRTKEKNLTIIKNIEDDTEIQLLGDVYKLKQIMINILSNAVKFTDEGKISITVKSQKLDENRANLLFTIEDTGIGIPKNKMSDLFKPFSQVDGSHTRKYGGTGLGLVISKEFVEMMEGEIGVDSIEGKGSIFKFNCIFKIDNEKNITENIIRYKQNYNKKAEEGEKNMDSETVIQARSGFNILLAEDNAVNQKVLLRFLSDAGYKVSAVFNGVDAINAVRSIKYDLVLMDIQMPDMDGLTASVKIRELNGNASKVPIIAITAHALMGDKEKCLRAGMNDYLSKPVNHQKLTAIIDKWLNITEDDAAETDEKAKAGLLIDFEHFENISLNNPDFQIDLASTYIADTLRRIDLLRQYIHGDDVTKAIAEAHTIKGASYSIGAVRMGETALGIEMSLKRGDVETADDYMPVFNGVYEETKQAYEIRLNKKLV